MLIVREKTINPTSEKNDELKVKKPKTFQWKEVKKIARNHSFLATIREIITWMEDSDVTKIGIVGKPDSGKSTMAEAIAHCIHKHSKEIPFAVRIFKKEHLMNFKQTLASLSATNYVLVFDDVSFLGADANKKQINLIKQAETTIRHLPGGEDVKIILIYNYHYTLGLDKYLRQADYYYFTTIGSMEGENVLSMVGKKYSRLVEEFKRIVVSAKSKKYWSMIIGPKEPILYRYRKPFIPALFYNNQSLRFIISPKREWIDAKCNICEIGIKISHEFQITKSVDELVKSAEERFGPQNFKAAVKLKLFITGLTVYGKRVVRASQYIDKLTNLTNAKLEDLAAHYGFTITKPTRVQLKASDPIYTDKAIN